MPRRYQVYLAGKSRGAASVEIIDEIGPFTKDAVRTYPGIARSAMKNTGYLAMQEVKHIYKNEGKGFGVSVAPKSKLKMSANELNRTKRINKKRTGEARSLSVSDKKKLRQRRGPLFGKLGSAVGFQDIENGNTRIVGFISKSSASIARNLQKQGTVRTTPSMYGHFMKLGIRLKSHTRAIRRPRREVFSVYYRFNIKRHVLFFEKKLFEKIEKRVTQYNASRRVA